MSDPRDLDPDGLHDLLALALDEELPAGAEERCIERIAKETGPIPILPKPPHAEISSVAKRGGIDGAGIELHLRVRVTPGRRGDFLKFLREVIPFYEAPGGIRMRVLQDRENPDRFIEIVEYKDSATYRRDQERVASDPEMRQTLDTWREFLAEPPTIETYTVRSLI